MESRSRRGRLIMSSKFTAIYFYCCSGSIFSLRSAIFLSMKRERVILLRFRSNRVCRLCSQVFHFKIPFVMNSRFDGSYSQPLIWPTPARYLTGEKKNVIVGFFYSMRVFQNVADYFHFRWAGWRKCPSCDIRKSSQDGLRAEFGRPLIQEVRFRRTFSHGSSGLMMESKSIAKWVLVFEVWTFDSSVSDLPDEVSSSFIPNGSWNVKLVAKGSSFSRGAEKRRKTVQSADRQTYCILAEANRLWNAFRGEVTLCHRKIYARLPIVRIESFYSSFYRPF